ncbi:hypothetical protein PAXRUDRAFT_228082 [Paxillus rubicundulus Ve08.2h10]|uniref:Uncharacterized protein n=1 Tax=Paxillus rubicundulus Ve08.2h10 TaxID=930991 RepID=A0A0D0CCY2_9AGAM|nr:hypothetical protein PAXRUDRAFT_228082 [Paxillus rubicundulus Ve08.2h10]
MALLDALVPSTPLNYYAICKHQARRTARSCRRIVHSHPRLFAVPDIFRRALVSSIYTYSLLSILLHQRTM